MMNNMFLTFDRDYIKYYIIFNYALRKYLKKKLCGIIILIEIVMFFEIHKTTSLLLKTQKFMFICRYVCYSFKHR